MLCKSNLGRASLAISLVLLISSLPVHAAPPIDGPGPWTKYPSNPVFNVNSYGAWDSVEVVSPAVLYDGAIYQMWYSGSQGVLPYSIGYATSADGLSWSRSASNPVLSPGTSGSWDAGAVRNATVINDSGVYKMWYSGRDTNGVYKIGYATSPNGVTWTKSASNPVLPLGASGSWDETLVGDPTVIKSGGTYMMWYRGQSNSGISAIGYATSANGTSWTKYSDNPVISSTTVTDPDYRVYAPRVVYADGIYYMWYSAGNWVGTAWEIYYATSANGTSWTKRGRAIAQGPDGSYDRYSADFGSVIFTGNTFKMWYSGYDYDSYYQIGYASSPSITLASKVFLPMAASGGSCNPVFLDDFSDYHSGWLINEDAHRLYDYTSGEYRVYVKDVNSWYWTTRGTAMTNGIVAVNMRFASAGNNSDSGGAIFGLSPANSDNFYKFKVSRNGAYCIQRHSSSGFTDLGCGTASNFSSYPATNRLKVERNGNTITVYINGQLQKTVNDSTYLSSGRVGLITESGAAANSADVRYDNYAVYPASCNVQ